MKLLFDQNISFKVVKNIQDVFKESKHLSDLKLEASRDIENWHFAREHNYCIVTFDHDFIDISALKGFPPKVIWLRMGNTTTDNLISRFRFNLKVIEEFMMNAEIGFLEIR